MKDFEFVEYKSQFDEHINFAPNKVTIEEMFQI